VSKNVFDLDPERLATTDEAGHRIYLYPEEVSGKWKERRQYVYWGLIALYLILPWINIAGKPALQVDIFNREFTFMGGTIYGVEPILMFLFLVSGLFLIAFLTSLFGRVWCGWACPQTVFIQSIFWKIEKITEGSARKRRELDASKWSLEKTARRVVKWGLFLIVSLHIAHTFVGYFVGPRNLIQITMGSPSENWGLFVSTMILTTIFLLDFGWFREQFCIIACPYGRIQSVMMDDNSLVVGYDKARGEPRFGTVPKGEEGDCVNCFHCVRVCPTGIDIRRGVQLECIHCTQCIDACDAIMEKVKKPKGLIKYTTERELQGQKQRLLNPRSMLYIAISTFLMVSFFFFLNSSTQLKLTFLRAKVPFIARENGEIMNNFQLKLTHQGGQKMNVDFEIADPALRKSISVITPTHPTVIAEPEKKIVIFFRFPQEVLIAGKRSIILNAVDSVTKAPIAKQEVILVGPTR